MSKGSIVVRAKDNLTRIVSQADATDLAVGVLSAMTGNPWLAPGVTLLRAALNLRFGVLLDQRRAELVLKSAIAERDKTLLEVMFLLKQHPKREQLYRELRLRLRDIADALDDAVVEPLIKVMQLQAQGEINVRRAEQLVRLIQPLQSKELHELRVLILEMLEKGEGQLIGVMSWHDRKDGSEPVTAVGVGVGKEGRWVDVSDCTSSLRLFRLMRESELAVARSIWANGDVINGRPHESISIEREVAALILRVVSV